MPVKPESSHLRAWDSKRLVVTFGWEDQLDALQQTLLPRLRKHFMDMVEIESASLTYYQVPTAKKYSEIDETTYRDRLIVEITYAAAVFDNDSDSMRQHLEQGIEADIVNVLFGDATIDYKGVVTRPEPDNARPAHIIQV